MKLRAARWLVLCSVIWAYGCGSSEPAQSDDGTGGATSSGTGGSSAGSGGAGSSKPDPSVFDLVWGPESAASPVLRTEAQGIAANGKLYVFAGYLDPSGEGFTVESDAYDPETDTWTRIADMPSPITHGGVAFDGDDTIWVAGGFPGVGASPATREVWKYKISEDSWSAGPDLPYAVGGAALVRYDRKLHSVSGGERDAPGPITQDLTVHWILDLDEPSSGWQDAAPMPEPGNHLGGCRVGDWIYIVGGQKLQDEDAGNLATVRAFNPTLDSWKLVADMPLPLGHIAASVVEYKGSIIVVGGITSGVTFNDQVLSYNPAEDTWSNLTNLPAPRKSGVVGIVGQTLIVSGGEGSDADTIRGTLSP